MTAISTQRELTERARTDVCSICGNRLDVAFAGGWKLRCGQCQVYDPETRPRYEKTLLARFRDAQYSVTRAGFTAIEVATLSRTLENRIAEKEGAGADAGRDRAVLLKLQEDINVALVRRDETALVNPEEAVRFLDFGKMTNSAQVREMAVALIRETGLNPMLNEITVYEGKLYITVQGLGNLMGEELDGIDPARWWTAEERQAAGYAADDIVCSVTVYRRGRTRGFTGTGKANVKRPHRNSAVEAAWGPRTAENRALRQAYRLGFQDLLRRHRTDVLPEEIDEPAGKPRIYDVPASDVNTVTGEYTPDAMPPVDEPQNYHGENGEPGAEDRVTAAIAQDLKAAAMAHLWDSKALKAHLVAVYSVERVEDLTVAQAMDLSDHLEMDGKPKG